jgi:hypothetical protein
MTMTTRTARTATTKQQRVQRPDRTTGQPGHRDGNSERPGGEQDDGCYQGQRPRRRRWREGQRGRGWRPGMTGAIPMHQDDAPTSTHQDNTSTRPTHRRQSTGLHLPPPHFVWAGMFLFCFNLLHYPFPVFCVGEGFVYNCSTSCARDEVD